MKNLHKQNILAAILVAMTFCVAETSRADVITGSSIDFTALDFSGTSTARKGWSVGGAGLDTYIWDTANFAAGNQWQMFNDTSNADSYFTFKATVPGSLEITDFTFAWDRFSLLGEVSPIGDDQVALQYSIDGTSWITVSSYVTGPNPTFIDGGSFSSALATPSSEVFVRFAKVENTILGDSGNFQLWSNFNPGGPSAGAYLELTTQAVPEPSVIGLAVLGIVGSLAFGRKYVRREMRCAS